MNETLLLAGSVWAVVICLIVLIYFTIKNKPVKKIIGRQKRVVVN